ncbi:hypothetical protein NKW55_15700, partial [Gluconobacter kondonii]|uniref:hypothetical protein n=1 Tax=Gluconobacter kondonii TaxID=941463 RepID=UPI00209E982E
PQLQLPEHAPEDHHSMLVPSPSPSMKTVNHIAPSLSPLDSGFSGTALERLKKRRPKNPLAAQTDETIDDVYGIDEANAGCVICHK